MVNFPLPNPTLTQWYQRTVTRWFAVALSLLLVGTTAHADDCGLSHEVIPDFTLVDVNPTSPSYNQLVSRDQLLGDVIVMYWAHAT